MYLLTEWEGRTGKYLARGKRVRTSLATDEVVLHGTIRLDSKIRFENVHFHD